LNSETPVLIGGVRGRSPQRHSLQRIAMMMAASTSTLRRLTTLLATTSLSLAQGLMVWSVDTYPDKTWCAGEIWSQDIMGFTNECLVVSENPPQSQMVDCNDEILTTYSTLDCSGMGTVTEFGGACLETSRPTRKITCFDVNVDRLYLATRYNDSLCDMKRITGHEIGFLEQCEARRFAHRTSKDTITVGVFPTTHADCRFALPTTTYSIPLRTCVADQMTANRPYTIFSTLNNPRCALISKIKSQYNKRNKCVAARCMWDVETKKCLSY
jgi:hypothetical protein